MRKLSLKTKNKKTPKSIKSCLSGFEIHVAFFRKFSLSDIWGGPLWTPQAFVPAPIVAFYGTSIMLAHGGCVIKDSWVNVQLWDPTMSTWAFRAPGVPVTSLSRHVPCILWGPLRDCSWWQEGRGGEKERTLLASLFPVYTRSWSLFSFSASQWQEYRFGSI